MTDPDRPDIDDRVSCVFEPDAPTVARVSARALGAAPGSGRPSRLALSAAAVAVAGLVLAAVLTVSRGSQTPAAPAGPKVLTGALSDGLLVIEMPDGSTSITGGPARAGRSPEGHGLLLVEGEPR